jgi:PAS domain-containing protein
VQHANSAIIWRTDGTIVFFNEYAQQFSGIAPMKSSPMCAPSPRSGLDRQRPDAGSNIATHPERFEQNINENICRDGRRVWMVWTNTPVRDGLTSHEIGCWDRHRLKQAESQNRLR